MRDVVNLLLLPWHAGRWLCCAAVWVWCASRHVDPLVRWAWTPVACWDCGWGGPIGNANFDAGDGVFLCPRCRTGEL